MSHEPRRRPEPPADDDAVRRPASHKNTRRWCKGVVGVEHKPEWRQTTFSRQSVCVVCGRHLGYDCTRFISLTQKIRQLRKEAKLTQEQLAAKVCRGGYGPYRLSALELVMRVEDRSERTTVAEYRRVLEALGYSLSWTVTADPHASDNLGGDY